MGGVVHATKKDMKLRAQKYFSGFLVFTSQSIYILLCHIEAVPHA